MRVGTAARGEQAAAPRERPRWSRPLWRAIALSPLLALAAHVAPAIGARLRGPIGAAAAPRRLDLCDSRRPDGTLPPCCAAPGEATLLFGGDTALADAALETLALRGFDFPFSLTRDLLRDADAVILNLEAPIVGAGSHFPVLKQYVYRSPPEAAPALALAGVDVVGLANNHALDQRLAGLRETRDRLAHHGVASVGAGDDEAEARGGLIVRAGTLRVGLIARCQRRLDWDLWVQQFASGPAGGVAAFDEAALVADVAALRAHADLVVLLAHWGPGYGHETAGQRALAEAAARAGVDLVVGHHPHVAQPLYRAGARGVPIALSLGNYAFGTPGHRDLDIGLLLRARVRGTRLSRLELVPIDVQNRRVGYRPTPLVGPAAAAALRPLVERSAGLGTALRIEGDAAVLDLTGGETPPRAPPGAPPGAVPGAVPGAIPGAIPGAAR